MQLAAATFGILALELALIRWASGQVRVLAYFNNLILIAAFLGMGLGLALGRRWPGLLHLTLPLLTPLAALLALAPQLGLTHFRFPDTSIVLWGGEAAVGLGELVRCVAIVLGFFWSIVAVFVAAGGAVGHLFGRLPVLRAYTWDLVGSLAGVLALTLVTALGTGPPVWLFAGTLPFLLLSRRLSSAVAAGAIVLAGWISIDGAVFSPYSRIDLSRDIESQGGAITLEVNRDFHQYMHDLSPAALASPSLSRWQRQHKADLERVYDLPFVLGDARGRALVVGAGTGNDAQAALRGGFREVVSVEIDGTVVDLGRRLHPEQPYSDSRSRLVVDDARAFFERYRGAPFDVVCYGLLDSHALFSAMSTLRLENYVYTREGIAAAWRHVAPNGLLAIDFSVFAGDWIADRLYWTMFEATGRLPIAIDHGMQYGRTFVVTREPARLHLERVQPYPIVAPTAPRDAVRTTTDDWPFLYVRPGQVPWGYLIVLALILASGTLATRRTFAAAIAGRDFDGPLFFMGAAFLLLETRGVTTLSLLFGSTWVVNAAVFLGVLVMALAANQLVERRPPRAVLAWFVPLLASVALVAMLPTSALDRFSLPVRGLLGGLLIALPIGVAGVVVSSLLARARRPAAALGSNLIGALVGGCLEYASMWLGLRAMAAVAFVFYAVALLWSAARLHAGQPVE